MAAPLIARDTVIGLMAVWRQSPGRPFTDADLAFFVGTRPAGDDRDRERPVLHRGPRGAPRGRGREPGQEHVPRGDEPRDPDADERDHRDERAAARHAARHRAAEYAETIKTSGDALLTVINDILDFSKIEAGKVELDTQPIDLRRTVEGALDLLAAPAAAKGVELALRGGRRAARGHRGRPGPAPPDRHQPAVERAQVHGRGRGGAAAGRPPDRRPRGRRGPALGDHGRRPRHRDRHPARGHGPAVPVVQPGRRLHLAPVRRHGARARDQPPPGRADGRHADGGEQRRRGRGQHLPPHDPRRRGRAAGARRRRPIRST